MVLLLVHPRPRTSSNTVTVITSQIHAYQDGSPGLTIHCQTCIRDENYIHFYYTAGKAREDCYKTVIILSIYSIVCVYEKYTFTCNKRIYISVKSNSHLCMYMVNEKERYIEFFHEF